MTSELARQSDTSDAIQLLPPAQPPAHAAIEMLRGHADMMSMAYDLANKICRTQLVPTRFRGKAEDATAAILYGAELGLNPIQSLQRVIAIHGMPTIEARTMVALLKSRGYRIKTLEQSDEQVTVEGFDLAGERYVSQWTIERAKKAKYVPEIDERTGKYKVNANGNLIGNEKYITDPQAMLKAKAQAEVCRDMAPDVLLGISYSTEDMDSEQPRDYGHREAPQYADAITVDEIVGGEQTERQRSFKDKVRAAAVDDSDGVASENRPEPETAQVSETGPVDDAPADPESDKTEKPFQENVTPPGAPTDDTPGQTERVGKALGNASSKAAYLGLITALFREAGCEDAAEQAAAASEILKNPVGSLDVLSSSQLKTVHNALNAWKNVGTLTDMVARILDAADMKAEEPEESPK